MEKENKIVKACESMEPDLILYYYRELEGTEQRQVEDHIAVCEPCRTYVQEMTTFLPLAAKSDEPPQIFWDNYNREMRQKLAELKETKSWWRRLASLLQPWPVPAIAMATVAGLALTFTLGKGLRQNQDVTPADQDIIEVMPLAENLDFFKNMDVLDDLDLLDDAGSSDSGTT